MNKLLEKMKEQEFTTREFLFMGISLFLSGIVLGILLSPKGNRVVGSNNGNNNNGYVGNPEDLEAIEKKEELKAN